MTFGIVLLKGKPEKREDTEALLYSLQEDEKFSEEFDVKINQVFRSLGWPDLVLIIEANNIERMMKAIVEIRNKARTYMGAVGEGNLLDTTTLVCTTKNESKERRESFSEKFKSFNEFKN